MPSSLPPEDSVCSTDSTQPYLPGQAASQVDPYLIAGYYAGMPDIPDLRRVRPRRVDAETREANPAFYNPNGVNDNHAFKKSMLPPRKQSGLRLSRMFGEPKVGFGSNESRYFFEDDKPQNQYPNKPEVQHVRRSVLQAPAPVAYARSNGNRSIRDSPAPRHDDYYVTEKRQDTMRPTTTYRRNNSHYAYPAPSIPQSTPRRDSFDIYERPKQGRRHSKLLHRRKSSARDRAGASGGAVADPYNESPSSILRPMTRSRQNSAAGGHITRRKTATKAPGTYELRKPGSYGTYASKPTKTDDYYSAKRVITVPSASNAAYYNAKYPQGDSRTQEYRDAFWRLNGFEFDNHQAWREYHWGSQ